MQQHEQTEAELQGISPKHSPNWSSDKQPEGARWIYSA